LALRQLHGMKDVAQRCCFLDEWTNTKSAEDALRGHREVICHLALIAPRLWRAEEKAVIPQSTRAVVLRRMLGGRLGLARVSAYELIAVVEKAKRS